MTHQKALFPSTSPADGTRPRAAGAPSLAVVAPSTRAPFELELRRLVRQRLNGEIDYITFCQRNLQLHFQHGRRGYTPEQCQRDMAEHRDGELRSRRRQQLDAFLRGDPLLALASDAPVEGSTTPPPCAVGA